MLTPSPYIAIKIVWLGVRLVLLKLDVLALTSLLMQWTFQDSLTSQRNLDLSALLEAT